MNTPATRIPTASEQAAAVSALLGVPAPAGWMASARCAQTDPEVFFPEQGGAGTTAWAKRVCRRCPVRLACLNHALARRENDGVWGGLLPNERRRLLRGARRDVAAARRRCVGADAGVAG